MIIMLLFAGLLSVYVGMAVDKIRLVWLGQGIQVLLQACDVKKIKD